MKRYNKTIVVHVELDHIASMLRKQFAADSPIADSLTETIIESSVEKDTIGFVYNSLCGFSNELEGLDVDRLVSTEEKAYMYIPTTEPIQEGEERRMTSKTTRKEAVIGECVIREINVYRGANSDVRIEYDTFKADGTPTTDDKWVAHSSLTLIPQ